MASCWSCTLPPFLEPFWGPRSTVKGPQVSAVMAIATSPSRKSALHPRSIFSNDLCTNPKRWIGFNTFKRRILRSSISWVATNICQLWNLLQFHRLLSISILLYTYVIYNCVCLPLAHICPHRIHMSYNDRYVYWRTLVHLYSEKYQVYTLFLRMV